MDTPRIAPNGAWLIADPDTPEHKFDEPLCRALIKFVDLKRISSAVDLGCGPGHYERALSNCIPVCDGYDGNPHTPWITDGRCGMLDLSVPVKLMRRYDLVLSLEVGEHIPPAYEDIYLDNVTRASRSWVVLSWAVPGQGGLGHVNERPNAHIIAQMDRRGFVHRETTSACLRDAATLPWFKNTLMAFELHGSLRPA